MILNFFLGFCKANPRKGYGMGGVFLFSLGMHKDERLRVENMPKKMLKVEGM